MTSTADARAICLDFKGSRKREREVSLEPATPKVRLRSCRNLHQII